MAYGQALGTVGEPTKFSCANLADEYAFTVRGNSTRTRNHALLSFETKHANA